MFEPDRLKELTHSKGIVSAFNKEKAMCATMAFLKVASTLVPFRRLKGSPSIRKQL